MKKVYNFLLFVLLLSSKFLFANGAANGDVGVILSVNGGSKTLYNVFTNWSYGACNTYNTGTASNFNGTNLGNVSSLVLNGMAITGWTDNTDFVSGRIEYKIWLVGQSEPGTITGSFDVGGYGSNCSGATNVMCSSGNNRFVGIDNQSVDLLNGLTSGNYNFKIWSFGQMRYNCGTFNQVNNAAVTGNFTVLSPSITSTQSSITSNSTQTYKGATITINGTALGAINSVKIGGSSGVACTNVTVVNSTQVTCTVPDGTTGGTIWVSDGTISATSTDNYTNLGYITTATGNWSQTATWLGNTVPTATDNATVANTHIVTVTNTQTINNLTINSGGSLGNGSNTLNISGVFLNNGDYNSGTSGVLNFNGSSITNNGTFYINGGTINFNTATGTFTNNASFNGGTGGTFNFGGNNLVNNYDFYFNSGTLNLTNATSTIISNTVTTTGKSFNVAMGTMNVTNSATFTNSGNFDGGAGGKINFNGATTFTNNSSVTLNNLILSFNGSSLNLTNGTSGTFIGNTATVNINAPATITNNNTTTSTFTAYNATFNFTKNSTISGDVRFKKVNINSGASVDFGTASYILGDPILANAGILTINSGSVINNGPRYFTNSTLIYNTGGTYNVGREWSANAGQGYPEHVQISNSTTVTGFSGTNRGASGNLTIDSSSTLTIGNITTNMIIVGNVLINGTLNLSTNTDNTKATFSVGGNFTNNGTFTHNNKNVIFNGTSVQTIATNSAPIIFAQLTIKNTGGGVTLSNDVTAITSLTLTSGIVNAGTNTLYVNNTGITSVSGGNSSSYVNGALKRDFISGASSGEYIFPVGNGGAYLPFSVTNPVGTSPVTVQAYNANSGGSSSGITISTSEYWKVSGNTLSSGLISLTKTSNTYNTIGSSSTQNGTYTSANGANTNSTFSADKLTVNDSFAIGDPQYFVLANMNAPTNSSLLVFSNVTHNSMTLTWTNGNGIGRIVVAKAGSAPTGIPALHNTYTANAAYGTTGTALGDGFVVYNGNSNTVNVTNLNPATNYYFIIYEYNGSGYCTTYQTVSPLSGNQMTLGLYFRSAAAGPAVWETSASWQQSADGATGWTAATTVPNSFARGVNIQSGHTITVNSAVTPPSTNFIVNGTLDFRAGGSVSNSPTYATNSTLKYNTGGNYNIFNEWTATAIPYNVTIGDQVNNSSLNFGSIIAYRQLDGSLTVGTGTNVANLYLSTAFGGDLKIKGNYSVAANSFVTNNGRAVFFIGTSGNQVVTKIGGGTIYFDYLIIDKTTGNLQLSASPATNIQINSSSSSISEYKLQISNGNLDLNGQTFTMNSTASQGSTEYTTNIQVGYTASTGVRKITSSTGIGIFNVTGNYSAQKANTLVYFPSTTTLTFDANVTLQTSVGLDFGVIGSSSATTINSIFQINQYGFVIGHSPNYGNVSTLIYNNGASGFYRNLEWNANSGAGYPNDIIVKSGTTVELSVTYPVPNTIGCSGSLTIENGATLKQNNMGFDLKVSKDINLAGTMEQSTVTTANTYLNGNWTQSGTGSLVANGNKVIFNKQSATVVQNISGSTTFGGFTINNAAGVIFTGTSDNNTVNNNLNFTAGKITLNSNNLIMGITSSLSNYDTTKYIVTNGSGLLKRTLAANKIYPVGTTTSYNPITLTNSGTSDVYGIRVAQETVTDGIVDGNTTLNTKWYISEATSGNTNLSVVTPQWNTSDQASQFSGCGTEIGLWDGTTWLFQDATYAGTNPYTANLVSGNLNPTDVTLSKNAYITVGSIYDTTTWYGPAVGGSWSHCTPKATINAVIDGTYDTSVGGAFTAKTLKVDSSTSGTKTLIIKPNGSGTSNYVSVVNGITNNGTLTVESDGSLIQQTDGATFTGNNITVKRNLNLSSGRNEYNYISSPTINFNLKNSYPGVTITSTYPKILYYNETNDYFYSSSGAYIVGRGLALKEPTFTDVPTASVDLTFTGAPYNSPVGFLNYALAMTNASHGYNLVGNPYPSNIDLNTLYTASSNIESTFRFWDNTVNNVYVQQGSSYQGYSYAIYNAAAGSSGLGLPSPGTGSVAPGGTSLNGYKAPGTKTPNKIVKVGQGFIARASASGAQIVFRNSERLADNTGAQFFGKTVSRLSNEDDSYYLTLTTPSNLIIPIGVVYFSNGNNDFSADDSMLAANPSDAFYSLASSEKVLINGRSSFIDTDVVDLGTSFGSKGNYTISLGNLNGKFNDGQKVYLLDKVQNTITDLQTSSYTFEVKNLGAETGRFQIVYLPQNVLAVNDASKQDVLVYKSGENFVVKSSNKILNIELFDGAGRLILKQNPMSFETTFDSKAFAEGVYYIKINNSKSVITRKILK